MIFEVHLTYRCNLRCQHCNRGVGLGVDHTPDLTIPRYEQFLRDMPDYLRIKGRTFGVAFTGGEPTLVGDLVDWVEATYAIAPHARIGVFSNAATPRSQKILAHLFETYGIRNGGSTKPGGQPSYRFATDMFCSPVDTGQVHETPCSWARKCGSSLDAGGMTLCPIGGLIDGVLKLGLRTWDWNELTLGNLMKLCAHCGRGFTPDDPPELRYQERPVPCEVYDVRGFRMTKEWKDAVERWRPEPEDDDGPFLSGGEDR